jgi:outer membrane lipoprotein-sorting protein
MLSRRWTLPVLIIAFCVTAGCSTTPDMPITQVPEESYLSGPEVAAKFVETYDSMRDLSATINTTSEHEESNESVMFKNPDKYRICYLEHHTKGYTKKGDLVVVDGKTQWHYINATGDVRYISAKDRQYAFPEEYATGMIDFLTTLRNICAAQECSLAGVRTENVTNVYSLEITNTTQMAYTPYPREFPIYTVHVDIEEDVWMPRRAEVFNSRGTVLMTVEYRNFTLNQGIPDAAFTFTPPEGSVVEPMRTVAITPPDIFDAGDHDPEDPVPES